MHNSNASFTCLSPNKTVTVHIYYITYTSDTTVYTAHDTLETYPSPPPALPSSQVVSVSLNTPNQMCKDRDLYWNIRQDIILSRSAGV